MNRDSVCCGYAPGMRIHSTFIAAKFTTILSKISENGKRYSAITKIIKKIIKKK